MSIDTYFCFCCLSTNDLSCLYSSDPNTNYADLLKTLFSITISFEDYEYDSHICKGCAQILQDINKFKTQVCEIINILQSNGLIELTCDNNQLNINKTASDNALVKEDKYVFVYEDSTQETIPKPKTIKLEPDTGAVPEDCAATSHNKEFEEVTNSFEVDTDTHIQATKDVTLLNDRSRINESKNNLNDASVKSVVEQVTQYVVTDDLKCKLCEMVLPNLYMYHAHMNQHYPNHICESCGKGFLTAKRLKRHIPSHKAGLFKCQWCDAEFTNYNTLNSHRQRKHSTVALYKCPYCSLRFTTFTQREVHLTATHHKPSGKYVCRVCDKRFLIAGNLSAHMRNKHLKTKRHVCPICGASFQQRQELTAHESAHTGERAYQCDLCPKKYPRKKALIVHMRTHTDERRFACEVCGKRFIQKCTLLVHAKTHNRVDKVAANRTNLISINECVDTENVEFTFVRWTS